MRALFPKASITIKSNSKILQLVHISIQYSSARCYHF
uniref:Uncharacterized protein n=1 Tax=Ascaris lumbricoides TaxID=6252 RepID=A0A0M3HJR1_ASCLU